MRANGGISNLRGFTQSCERLQPSPPQYAIRRQLGFNLLCNFSEAHLRPAKAYFRYRSEWIGATVMVNGRQPRADKDKSILARPIY